MGTNWFMPAFVKSRFGESGMRLDEGTMVCCFDLKKSRYDWRICDDVIMAIMVGRGVLTAPRAMRAVPDIRGPLRTARPTAKSEPWNLWNELRQCEWKFSLECQMSNHD